MSTSTQVSSTSAIEDSQKRGRPNGEDHISNLPESVISHILSSLPIKDAVRTSVLSKYWEYKWTSICNIDIDDGLLYTDRGNEKTSFVDFVERILLLSQNIKNFRLSCRGMYNLRSRMTTWISAVLRCNVESFELHYDEAGIVFPRGLHSKSSLRKLKLELPCTFKVPFKNNFPNLTSLYLDGVQIWNELTNTDSLVLTFPVLEIFKLSECKWLNVKFVEIYGPSLCTFSSNSPYDAAVDDYSINIVGPKLVKFKSCGELPENFILTGLPVVHASLLHEHDMDDLQFLEQSGLLFRRLLKELSTVEKLELAVWVTEAIAASKQGLALSRFDKLTQLFLAYGTNIEALLELLHSAPSLKNLIVEMDLLDDYDYDAVESLPSCILSHLEKVVFHCYTGKTPQVNLAKFLFKNGIKLKKCYVNLDINNHIPKNEIKEQLSTLPKASTCLSVVVKQMKMHHYE